MVEKKRARPAPVSPLVSPRSTHPPARAQWGPRFLPGLCLLFVGSGCAALIYEIVWFLLLELVVGATAVSLGVLLATFMGGMCAGSLLLPRLVPADRHPLRVYAWLELGIAAMGLIVLFALPVLGRVYVATVGYGFLDVVFRALLGAV